jgi:hypothetical protein
LSLWHATADLVPPYGTIVWARFGNSPPFKAVRLLHRKRRKAVWGRQRPRGGANLLRDTPDYWAGVDGPVEPANQCPEPPAFEKFAKPPRPARPPAMIEGRPWWRDPCHLTYSEPGAVTPREAEGRLLRALLTCGRVRLESPKGPPSNSAWIAAQIERVEREMGLRPSYWHARFQPTARDVSDCAVALGWVAGLWKFDDRYCAVLRMRAADPPYFAGSDLGLGR